MPNLLSTPSKMPGYGTNLPATACRVGSELRKIKGSVCASCYAFRGNYTFKNVKTALDQRLEFLNTSEPEVWITEMTKAISESMTSFFRWHDSGDIQSLEHLESIVEVCKRTPEIKHWLPTREYRDVIDFVAKHGAFPENLTVRVSAPMVGQYLNLNDTHVLAGLTTSSVNAHKGWVCPSSTQGNKCLACRACWDPNIKNVDYVKH